jgi:murein DD-endopeptidase MepM/ murein hydrolase activator NlpD
MEIDLKKAGDLKKTGDLTRKGWRGASVLSVVALLSGCVNNGLDWDLRNGPGALRTSPSATGIAATGAPRVIGQTTPGSGIAPGQVDVTTIASSAIDRSSGAQAIGSAPIGGEAFRHTVSRGETAFTIARLYGVSAKVLAQWNKLDANLTVTEGQVLIVPNVVPAPLPDLATAPGTGTLTPTPPSSKKPLPDEKTLPAAEAEKVAKEPVADLGATRTTASAGAFAMPVQGKIIRGYQKKKNDGIDIAASAGTTVTAAASGTVAAVTKDTKGVPIVVIKHDGGLLTVYAGLDGLKVAKGDKVKRGQAIATVRAGDPSFVHFEIRKGTDSVDPMDYLQ